MKPTVYFFHVRENLFFVSQPNHVYEWYLALSCARSSEDRINFVLSRLETLD